MSAGASPFTYPEVGATAGELPAGYDHARRTWLIGRGPEVFERAAEALMTWQMHGRAGLTVRSDTPRATVGGEVLLLLGRPPIALHIPCRVVYVVDEPKTRGFAYGTLPGHPEAGEERFVVEHGADDDVVFTITVFSRPARLYARLGGPLTRLAQRVATARYASALRRTSTSLAVVATLAALLGQVPDGPVSLGR